MSRRLQVCSLIMFAAAFNGHSAVNPDSPILGALGETKGQVSVSGVPASNGATLTAGSLVATGADSAAKLVVRGSELTMRPNTRVFMPTASQSVNLRQGSLVVKDQSSENIRVTFPGAFVVIKSEGGSGAIAEVATLGTSSRVTVEHGFAEIHAAGTPMLLHAGQWARLDAVGSMPLVGDQSGASTGGGPEAGKVTREVPHGTVDRQGKQMPLAINDPVDWNDDVKTQDKGRLQITLTDGSVLSVGSRSEMKIVKHDPQSQQTDIELTQGTVKAEVQKVTKSDGHFTIHTKTAVIGVVGTTLVVKSDSKGTTVCNTTPNSTGEAEVSVTDANGQQTQKLKSGFCAFFPLTGAAVALTASASSSAIAGMTSATVITAAAAAGAAVGLSTGVIVAIVAAGVVGGTLGGLAASGAFSSSPSSPQ